jgi:hypothetical protein
MHPKTENSTLYNSSDHSFVYDTQLVYNTYIDIYIHKVVQIWPGQTVTCWHTNSPGHIWTTLYIIFTYFYPIILFHFYLDIENTWWRYDVQHFIKQLECTKQKSDNG